MKNLLLVCSFLSIAMALAAQAGTLEFTSSATRTTVLELYTSEGCSSCPPADRWLSQLKQDSRLWKAVIPLAFHVDYWDYLGWRDPLASEANSQRQREYARRGYTRSVYTPGLFINGREWNGWFRKPVFDLPEPQTAGVLAVRLTDQAFSATYEGKTTQPPALHVAVLGFDIRSQVKRGENRGKTLNHDFVVLTKLTLVDAHGGNHWQIDRNRLNLSNNHAKAIGVWVSTVVDPTPIQATGGWLYAD